MRINDIDTNELLGQQKHHLTENEKMELKLDFDPQNVAKALQDALVSTTFSEMISKVVKEETDKAFKEPWNSDSVIKRAVKLCIEQQVNIVVRQQLEPLIKQKMIEKLSEPETISKMVDHTINSIHFRD